MDKRGISGIVVTVILVAMTIGFISIIWVVITNLVNTGLDDGKTSLKTTNLNILSGSVKFVMIPNAAVGGPPNPSDTNFFLKLDRGNDENELTKINFLFYTKNDEATKIVMTNNLGPGEGKTYTFSTNDIEGAERITDLISVSVLPTIIIDGKEKILPETDSHEFNVDEMTPPD
jgi:flagellin-like protein